MILFYFNLSDTAWSALNVFTINKLIIQNSTNLNKWPVRFVISLMTYLKQFYKSKCIESFFLSPSFHRIQAVGGKLILGFNS